MNKKQFSKRVYVFVCDYEDTQGKKPVFAVVQSLDDINEYTDGELVGVYDLIEVKKLTVKRELT